MHAWTKKREPETNFELSGITNKEIETPGPRTKTCVKKGIAYYIYTSIERRETEGVEMAKSASQIIKITI